MEWKKRGIQLKSLRPDDPGHLALCEDIVRLSSLTDDGLLMEGPEEEPADEEPPLELPQIICRELEAALGLLDEALAATKPAPGDESG